MTDRSAASPAAPSSAETPTAGPTATSDGSVPPTRSPARDAFAGRAGAFRREYAARRSAQRERIGQVMVVAIIVLGVYAILTAKPVSSSSDYVPPRLGPTIVVHLGSPLVSSVPCGAGGTVVAERIPWVDASQPITTGDIALRVYEIWDGDFIGDPNAAPNVSASSLCAAALPNPATQWYAVLASPNSTNLLTYTVAQGWVAVTHGPWNFPVENGSALVLVANPSLADSGRGFQVFGFADGSPILGSVPL